MFSKVIKSDSGSLNGACRWSASAAFSRGRSLGSWMERADAMMATSARQPSFWASIIILEILGSRGIRTMVLPCSVREYPLPFLLMAPNSKRRLNPSPTLFGLGLSTKGKEEISRSLKESIRRITSARFDLRISGDVNSDRFS